MVWIIESLELIKDGEYTGFYRLTARSDEDGGGPYPLCNHLHTTKEEAKQCPEAQDKAKNFGLQIKEDPLSLNREDHLKKVKEKALSLCTKEQTDGVILAYLSFIAGMAKHPELRTHPDLVEFTYKVYNGYLNNIDKMKKAIEDFK